MVRSASPEAPAVRRLLIIDDHHFFSACLRTLVHRAVPGAEAVIVPGDADVLEQIERCQPHLLVLDLSVGKAGGYALGEKIRATGVETPILFASTGAPVPRSRLQQLGRASFVSKGSTPRQLVRKIKLLLSLNEPAAAPAAQPLPA